MRVLKNNSMNHLKAICVIISFILFDGILLNAQPIPVELMIGNKYGSVNPIQNAN